jgi:Peptidase inhibitor I78 family
MRKLTLLAPPLLAACATAPAEPLVHGETAGHTCAAAGTDQFLGREGTRETGPAIMHATHAAVLRWAPPGYMLTMDYRADRVTVRLGPDRKITAINCG